MKSVDKLLALATRFEKKADTAQSVKLFWVTYDPASANDVMKTQRVLRDRNYNIGNTGKYKDGVDGVWGNMSQAALKQFQQDNALPVTGQLDAETAAKLELDKYTETY